MTVRTIAIAALAVLALTVGAEAPTIAYAVPERSTSAPAQVPPVRIQKVLATGLTSPWGLAFLPDGSALISERDTGLVKRIPAGGGRTTTVGKVKGVRPNGEGGLLGLAVPPGPDPRFVFAYYTSARDNRVVRLAWDGTRLGRPTPILTGIPMNSIHDGGRLLVGPDDTLFVSTGETGNPKLAQDRRSLAGKVLRITFDGRPAPGNPFPHSPVYTLGHRNVQGLAFDSAGRLWASEFGQSDVDELNLLRPGRNYGWPVHEGAAKDDRFVNPAVQWSPTSIASPSGIAILDDIAYVASLRGEVLWQVPLSGTHAGRPIALRLGDLGRLRTVSVAPDGSLWLVTNNTDGRGQPRPRDDRILRLSVG
jgi:glucose/arabinose dehydrogenase